MQVCKKPFFRMKVKGVTPSLNVLFGMTHWQRLSVKKKIQAAFISSLRSAEKDGSTLIMSSTSGTLTVSGMLESFQMMEKKMSQFRSNKKKGQSKRP